MGRYNSSPVAVFSEDVKLSPRGCQIVDGASAYVRNQITPDRYPTTGQYKVLVRDSRTGLDYEINLDNLIFGYVKLYLQQQEVLNNENNPTIPNSP